jgi:hypothetical protein
MCVGGGSKWIFIQKKYLWLPAGAVTIQQERDCEKLSGCRGPNLVSHLGQTTWHDSSDYFANILFNNWLKKLIRTQIHIFWMMRNSFKNLVKVRDKNRPPRKMCIHACFCLQFQWYHWDNIEELPAIHKSLSRIWAETNTMFTLFINSLRA